MWGNLTLGLWYAKAMVADSATSIKCTIISVGLLCMDTGVVQVEQQVLLENTG